MARFFGLAGGFEGRRKVPRSYSDALPFTRKSGAKRVLIAETLRLRLGVSDGSLNGGHSHGNFVPTFVPRARQTSTQTGVADAREAGCEKEGSV
jgi:hypothetical protein